MLKWQIFSLKNFPKLYSEIENKRMYGIIYSSSFTSNQVESPVARRFATWKAKTRAPLRSDATFQTIRICKRTHMVWLYMTAGCAVAQHLAPCANAGQETGKVTCGKFHPQLNPFSDETQASSYHCHPDEFQLCQVCSVTGRSRSDGRH